MGDGREGERQPLLKNESVNYSSRTSDAIGNYLLKIYLSYCHFNLSTAMLRVY